MKLLLSGVAALAMLAAPALAQDSGVYIGGQLGGNWVLNDNSDFDLNFADGSTLGGIEYEGGVMLGALAGFKVSENFAVEAEGVWRHNQYEVLDQDDEGSVYGVMANAIYLNPLDDTTTLYFGAGIGIMGAEMDELAFDGGEIDPDVEGGFAYQLKAGLDYELDSGNVFGVGLTYMETDLEADEDFYEALGVVGDEFEIDYGAFSGYVTYKFGM